MATKLSFLAPLYGVGGDVDGDGEDNEDNGDGEGDAPKYAVASVSTTASVSAATDPGINHESLLHGSLLQTRYRSRVARNVRARWRHVVLNMRTGELSIYRCSSGRIRSRSRHNRFVRRADSANATATAAAAAVTESIDKSSTATKRIPTELIHLPLGHESRMAALALLDLEGIFPTENENQNQLELRLPRGGWAVVARGKSREPSCEDTFAVAYDPRRALFGADAPGITEGSAVSSKWFKLRKSYGPRRYGASHRGNGDGEKKELEAGGGSCNDSGDGASCRHSDADASSSTDSSGIQEDGDYEENVSVGEQSRSSEHSSMSSDESGGRLGHPLEASSLSFPPKFPGSTYLQKIILFRCPGGGNEKAMWCKAAEKVCVVDALRHRGSNDGDNDDTDDECGCDDANGRERKISALRGLAKNVNASLPSKLTRSAERITTKTWRYRKADHVTASAVRSVSIHTSLGLEFPIVENGDESLSSLNGMSLLSRGGSSLSDGSFRSFAGGSAAAAAMERAKEFRAQPAHAYPNEWMTEEELWAEMLRPSASYHDLGGDSCLRPRIDAPAAIVGSLHVEVLSCDGLPRTEIVLTDKVTTSSVVYLVCGPHAFHTDVITNTNNPRWLRRARRAAIFPISHPYARLYAGVFDPQHGSVRGVGTGSASGGYSDGFAGRVSIDVSSLRPESVYDVTLPLRQTTHVYTRRPRGTIRLRFRLEWHDERAAVLSYLPPAVRTQPVAVACGDKAAFRYVALTVHGIDMHGKWNRTIMNAASREYKLYKVQTMALAMWMITHLHEWTWPSMSLLVFVAWMHCVYRSSVALVPPYLFLFVIFWLLRNYARFVVGSTVHNGYAPITMRELFAALRSPPRKANGVRGRGSIGKEGEKVDCCRSWRPRQRQQQRQRQGQLQRQRRGGGGGGGRNRTIRSLEVKKRRPNDPPPEPQVAWLAAAIRSAGMWEGGNDTRAADAHSGADHLEFPFSDGDRHGKMTLEGSYAAKTAISTPRGTLDPREAGGGGRDCDRRLEPTDSDDSFDAECAEESANASFTGCNVERRKTATATATAAAATLDRTNVVGQERLGPEQNVDVPVPQTTTVLQDLDGLRRIAHACTGNLISDRVARARRVRRPLSTDESWIMRRAHSNSHSHLQRAESCHADASADEYDPEEDGDERDEHPVVIASLEKSLGIGVHLNPLLLMQDKYAGRMVKIVRVGLIFYRSVFNLFTWRDPFASFWILLACVGMVIVTAFFPWRLMFFVTGIAFVGPHNYIRRKLKQRRKAKKFKSMNHSLVDVLKNRITEPIESLPGPRMDSCLSASETIDSITNSVPFLSHSNNPQTCKIDDHFWASKKGEPIISEVVVPYSPLRQERFYDWPPEPTQSCVISVDDSELSPVNCFSSIQR